MTIARGDFFDAPSKRSGPIFCKSNAGREWMPPLVTWGGRTGGLARGLMPAGKSGPSRRYASSGEKGGTESPRSAERPPSEAPTVAFECGTVTGLRQGAGAYDFRVDNAEGSQLIELGWPDRKGTVRLGSIVLHNSEN